MNGGGGGGIPVNGEEPLLLELSSTLLKLLVFTGNRGLWVITGTFRVLDLDARAVVNGGGGGGGGGGDEGMFLLLAFLDENKLWKTEGGGGGGGGGWGGCRR